MSMPTLGTIYTYITDRGNARVAICSSVQEGGAMLTIFLNPGDDQFANGPVLVVQNVPNDPTGTIPNSYH
jgi:hypothetical protein